MISDTDIDEADIPTALIDLCERYLATRHSTMWGAGYDISNDDRRRVAATFLALNIVAVGVDNIAAMGKVSRLVKEAGDRTDLDSEWKCKVCQGRKIVSILHGPGNYTDFACDTCHGSGIDPSIGTNITATEAKRNGR